MANVFISYAREDRSAVLELYKTLKSEGFPLWMDAKDLLPGQEWEMEIEKAIRESVAFIACLSNNSVDKEGFVQAELKRALEVADLMPEGRIYIIPIRLDNCKVPSNLSKWHWVDYFEDGEKEKLSKAIQLRINQTIGKSSETSKQDKKTNKEEKYYDAGERIKTVRNELGLNTSQFAEILDLASQREYETMENRNNEVPLSLLSKISEISGVEVEWLKHGTGGRYKIEGIYLRPVEEDLNYCKSLNPKEYFLTLEPKSLHVGLVAQTGDYCYQVLDTGVTLDFWNWVDERYAIPAFYNFLKALSDPWHDIDGVILPANYEKQLYDGNIHFLTARRHANRYGRDLLYDILDIDEERKKPFLTYSKAYGGNWMHKVHVTLKEYLNYETNKKAGAKINKRDYNQEQITKKTIVFQEPTQLPTYERTIVWMFPFTVVDTSLLGQPEEVSRTALHEITVTAAIELVAIWSLFHPLTSTTNQEEIKQIRSNSQNIKKILFWYGKQDIEKKVRLRILQPKEKLLLTPTNTEVTDPLDLSRIPAPDGYRFEV